MTNYRFSPQRVRLFHNDWLERLTLISPLSFALTWAIVLPLVFWLSLGTASPAAWIALLLAGLVAWTLFEYVMHRFIFHLKPNSRFGRWVIHLAHGNHHVVPGDRYRNIMPPIVSITISAAMWCLAVLALGPAGTVPFLGWAIGYVVYDSVHYACHQLPMRSPLLRILRRHHIRHHYGRSEGNYAITGIFWDKVFGTEVPVKQRQAA